MHQGHTGNIYQSFDGLYLGRGTPRTFHLLPDGRVFSDRSAQKIRARERGWRYAAAQLESFGMSQAPEDGDARLHWLADGLQKFTTRVPPWEP